MAYDYVIRGPYAGFTHEDVLEALAEVDAGLKSSTAQTSAITSGSINGNSFTFGSPTTTIDPYAVLLQRRTELLKALAQVDDDICVPGSMSRASFRCGGFPYRQF